MVAQARETALHPLPALDGAEAMAALKARGLICAAKTQWLERACGAQARGP